MIKLILLTIIFQQTKSECNISNQFQLRDQNLQPLYEFGLQSGDRTLDKHDDHQYLLQKGIEFKFFNQNYTSLYISTNGVCELIKNEKNIFELSPLPKDFPLKKHAIIAPYWTDSSTDPYGDVFYRLVNDSKTLNQISCDIQRAYPTFSNFNAKWASVITWFQVRVHDVQKVDFNNTFQLILTTDNFYSFLIFNYGRLTWPNRYIQKLVLAGFNSGDNIISTKLNGSFQPEIAKMLKSSNVNIPSKWIFRVDNQEKDIKSFIKFGSGMNDTLIQKLTHKSNAIQIPDNKVKISRKTYLTQMFIYSNGLISLNNPYDSMPERFPLRDRISLLSAFWTNQSLISLNGDIYFREINDNESLAQIIKDVNLISLNEFEPLWSFVITYFNVGFETNSTNNVQVILTFDQNNNLFTIFNYATVNPIGSTIQIGYNLEMRDVYFELNETLINLCHNSNVNQSGKYVFHLGKLTEDLTTKYSTSTEAIETTMIINSEISSSFWDIKNMKNENIKIFVLVFVVVMILVNSLLTTIFCFRYWSRRKGYLNEFNIWYRQDDNDRTTLIINENAPQNS